MTTKSTIVVNDDLVREPNHLLEAETVLSYDTTFNLGNFYVSVLSFRHTMLTNSKHNTSFTIPVAFMIHDRKKTKMHSKFFECLAENIDQLSKKTVSIIVDREVGIIAGIKKQLPSVAILYFWNHLSQDLKVWLISRDAESRPFVI